ncbi:MAG: serine/threonine protein kinase, partial [Planctomycetes bacterium]|nr:serine/threonine protein kinase [Planctomycetota bacterium]
MNDPPPSEPRRPAHPARSEEPRPAPRDAATLCGTPPLPSSPGTPAAAPAGVPAPVAERRLGRYRLDQEIARGGMGIVYRAFDTQVQRTVALKLALGGAALSEDARRRFEREARLAARLRHPNIVPIFEVDAADGLPFYTMELVDGESLHALLRRAGPLPPRAAVRIARDAARALHHAHEQGLVHRDIKPGNLLLTRTGAAAATPADSAEPRLSGADDPVRVLIADFGLAREIAGDTRLTKSGQMVGTILYMAPEQADGDAARVGPLSDVYALGAVLYEMLCGAPPFAEAHEVRLLAAVLFDEPTPLRRRVPRLHPDLDTIVRTAMDKDPARRYASARAFAEDLERYLAGELIDA